MEIQNIRLADGRTLEILESGPAGGPVLLYHHGTPGTAKPPVFLTGPVLARGWRLVTFSRAGYAGSSRAPGRSVADVVSDTGEVLDAVGAEKALVAGLSGGGPHALACAALMPDRVTGALIGSGVAPYDAEGLDFLAGMGAENIIEFSAAVQGEGAIRQYLEGQAPSLRAATAEQIITVLASILPEVDRACITGELGDDLAASMHHALSGTVDGWLDDDLAFAAPWGFDLDAIRVPVSLWQGGQDLMVPFSHGKWLAAHVPGVHAHLEPAEGHLSLAIRSLDRMLDELAALSA